MWLIFRADARTAPTKTYISWAVLTVTDTAHHMIRLPNDIGGRPPWPTQRIEHELEPWEKRCGNRGTRQRDVGKLFYYKRETVAFANILFRKDNLAPT